MEPSTDDARVFVGRDAELSTLAASFAAAGDGAGELLLLVGDGGIGKTSTLEEFVRRTGLPPERVLWGRCPEQGGAPTYWPWIQALRKYADTRGADALREELGSAAPVVGNLLPGLGERLGLPSETARQDLADLRFRLFDGVAGFLRRAAGAEPLVVLFDDLHWADHDSLALLEFVAGELRQARVLVVGAYREREMRRAAPSAGLLRVGKRLTLRGFDQDEVRDFVATAMAHAPSDALAAELQQATAGNPFFLTELLASMAELGDAGALQGRLPEGVRAAIRRRLEPLPPEDRTVLDHGAVVGRDFTLPTVASACGIDAVTALERLAAGLDAGLIAEVAGEPGHFRFSHGLVREALYGDLLPAARMQAHRRVAQALEAAHAGSPDPPLAALAHHFFHAAPLGEAERAADYARRAADHAVSLGAHADAATLYERALQALGLVRADEALRRRLRISFAWARGRTGDETAAREAFLRAAESARAASDARHLAHAAIGYSWAGALTGAVDEREIRLLDEALTLLPTADGALRCHTIVALSIGLYFSLDHERAHALAREALAMAERLERPGVLGAALTATHYAQWHPAGAPERARIARALTAAGEQAGIVSMGLEGLQWQVIDVLELGDAAGARRVLEQFGRRAEAAGIGVYLQHAFLMRGMQALLEGRLDDAEARGLQALAVKRRPERSNALQFHAAQVFAIRYEQARLPELEAAVAAAVELRPTLPIWRAALAFLYVEIGRPDDARRELDVLAARDFDDVRDDVNRVPLLTICADVAAALGDRPRAARLYELLLPFADRWVVIGMAVACWGSVERYLGRLAAALGRPADAVAHCDRALAQHELGGAPALLGHTQIDRAILARAAGDATQAKSLVAAAQRIAERFGLARLAARARDLDLDTAPAASAAGGPPPVATPANASVAVLRREGEYWTIAHGVTVLRLKDSKGLGYLAMLLRHPNREFHVLDLSSEGAPAASGTDVGAAIEAGLQPGNAGDAGEMLDPAARAAYKRRIAELRETLAGAEAEDDVVSADDARQELAFIEQEMARGVGLGGRSRKAASVAERARQNVTRAILVVVRKIADGDAALGEQLTAGVRTGLFCAYEPGADVVVSWRVE